MNDDDSYKLWFNVICLWACVLCLFANVFMNHWYLNKLNKKIETLDRWDIKHVDLFHTDKNGNHVYNK